MEDLLKRIKELPLLPGCYIFKNKFDDIIYIGKSKALRNRVRQYFQNVDAKEGKYIQLSKEITDFQYVLTETETDALILECQLVKKHQPKYNAQLKRSKRYPFIKINRNLEYPTISVCTQLEKDGCEYFGFFYNEDDAYANIALMNKVWNTPICGKEKFHKSHRACLSYHLGRCCAPCEGRVSAESYQEKINEITKCLKGSYTSVIKRLRREMAEASKAYDFELAANRRDAIGGLLHLSKKSKRLNTLTKNRDIYLFFRAFREEAFTIFFIRNGKTMKSLRMENSQEHKHDLIAGLVEQVKNNEFDHEGDEFLTTCLIDIFAEKLYLPIPKRQRTESTIRLLEDNMDEFIENLERS